MNNRLMPGLQLGQLLEKTSLARADEALVVDQPSNQDYLDHARKLVFQLAEVLVTRVMLGGILERIGRLRLAPG